MSGDLVFYIQPDHLGTPRLVTDEQNKVVWRNLPTSEAFGNSPPEEDPSATGTPFKFNLRHSGYYFDNETQTFYAYLRDSYIPAIGAFGQSDPIGLNGGSWSTYSFVGGNPLSYTDPYGLFEMYGNWGGSNWSGGRSGPRISPNPLPPKDSLDECFMRHDYCYQKNEDNGQCTAGGPSKAVEKACDVALLQCMQNLPSNTRDWAIPPSNPVYGNNQNDPRADDFRQKADAFFRWKWK